MQSSFLTYGRKTVRFVIMADRRRSERASLLAGEIIVHGASCQQSIDDGSRGEWNNAISALQTVEGDVFTKNADGSLAQMESNSDYTVLVQDDAVIDDNFVRNVNNAINSIPGGYNDSLISFYTGEVRPFAAAVSQAVLDADFHKASWISMKTLYWGVCFAMPTKLIDEVVKESEKYPKLLMDRRIGEYFYRHNIPVLYTNPSLVDHDYTLPSLLGHKMSDNEKRCAHHYCDKLVEFNQRVWEAANL